MLLLLLLFISLLLHIKYIVSSLFLNTLLLLLRNMFENTRNATTINEPPVKILIGISLDPEDCKELLSWAIKVLACPNDNIVAVHILVDEESNKKRKTSLKKYQAKFRQAKARVISMLGEFASICQSKEINLEAKVRCSSSSIGRGLIEEAKSISADYLLLRGSTNRPPTRTPCRQVMSYCLEHAPESCTVVSLGKRRQQAKKKLTLHSQDSLQWNSSWSGNSNDSGSSGSSSRADSPVEISLKDKSSPSPKTVLNFLQGESHRSPIQQEGSESDSNSDSTSSFDFQGNQSNKMSPYRIISSLFTSPLIKGKKSVTNKVKDYQIKCFSYNEISNATNNFHEDNIVGEGGYSQVYRGELPGGTTIAVKRLAKDNKDPNKEKDFLIELGIIGHVCHPNTAKLVGYCIQNGLHLIFSFSKNGNLAFALHGTTSEPLDWPIRYKIAVGVARGLHYLHTSCKHRIIHRDIKASNVLLGPDYEPQITDFGLAKWLPNKWTHHAVIPIEGTFGYLAPEYFMHGIVDEKIDVFAFGVLLLEIVTGRLPVDSSKKNLLLWAKPLMEAGNITELADPTLEGKYDGDQMHRLVLTACYCVRQSAICRPSMSEVLDLLTSGSVSQSQASKGWRMPKFTSDEPDDYSMIFGYQVPTDISSLED